MISFNESMLLLRSNHFLIYGSFINLIIIFVIFILLRSHAYLGEQDTLVDNEGLRQSDSLLNPKSIFLCNESSYRSNLGYLPYLACGGVRPFSRTPGRCRDVPLVKQCASGYCHPTKSSTYIMSKDQLQNFIALLNKIGEKVKSVNTGSEDPLSTFSCVKNFSICWIHCTLH